MKINLIKKIILLIFVLSFSIVCYAAIVSDDDKSGFVSKYEFDSLKREMQNQITNYNRMMDKRIDGAIDNYLSQIDLAKQPMNLFESYITSHGQSPRFYWNIPGVGERMHVAKVDSFFDKELCYKVWNNLYFGGYFYKGGSASIMGVGLYFNTEPNWQGAAVDWKTLWLGGKYSATNDSNDSIFSRHALGNWSSWNSNTPRTSEKRVTTISSSKTLNPGMMPVWTMLETNGRKSLYLYQTNSVPYLVLTIHRHVYKDYASLTASYYTNTSGKIDYDTSKTTIIAQTSDTQGGVEVAEYGEKTYGDNYTGTSEDIGNYIKVNIQKIETNNNIDYRNVVFPTNSNNIWYISTNPKLKVETTYTEQTLDNNYWYDMCYPNIGGGALQTNLLYGAVLKYYRPYFEANEASIQSFEIPYISSLAGEPVNHGQGFPILQAITDDTNCTVKLTIKNNNDTKDKVTCLFSDKKLVGGTGFNADANIKKTIEFECGSEYSIDFEGIKKDDKIWINPISGPADYVYIENVDVKVK